MALSAEIFNTGCTCIRKLWNLAKTKHIKHQESTYCLLSPNLLSTFRPPAAAAVAGCAGAVRAVAEGAGVPGRHSPAANQQAAKQHSLEEETWLCERFARSESGHGLWPGEVELLGGMGGCVGSTNRVDRGRLHSVKCESPDASFGCLFFDANFWVSFALHLFFLLCLHNPSSSYLTFLHIKFHYYVPCTYIFNEARWRWTVP